MFNPYKPYLSLYFSSFVKTLMILLILSSFFSTVNAADNKDDTLSVRSTNTIVISSDDDFLTYSFTGNGSKDDPFLIQDYTLDLIPGDAGIIVQHTTLHFVIKNCYIEGGAYGIFLYNVAAGTAAIANNTLVNNRFGIHLVLVDDITLTFNTFELSVNFSVFISNCNEFYLTNNIFDSSLHSFIYSEYSSASLCTFNLFQYSQYYAIFLTSSAFNHTFHHNTFYKNHLTAKSLSQALDYNDTNNWNSPSLLSGNYWSDAETSKPYAIGGGNAYDNYPLDTPPVSYMKKPGLLSYPLTSMSSFFTLMIGMHCILMRLKKSKKNKI